MHHLFKTLVTCMAIAAGPARAQLTESASIAYVSGCAAVVSTTDVCTTCVTAACVVPATVTAGCGTCADTPPTIYRSFPCDEGCEDLGCQTVYEVVTATEDACVASPTPTENPDDNDGGDGGEEVTSTLVSTAGAAARLLPPLRLW